MKLVSRMKMKIIIDFALFFTCYSSFCFTLFLIIHGLAFFPTSSDVHKLVYGLILSEALTAALVSLVHDHLITKADQIQIVGLNDFIIVMHEKLKSRHPIVWFPLYSAPSVIGMSMIVDRPWTMGAATVSFFTFVVSGCSLFTTPRAAAVVARPLICVPMITLVPVLFGRSNYVVLGLLVLLFICCFRSYDCDMEENIQKPENVGGTYPKSLEEPLLP